MQSVLHLCPCTVSYFCVPWGCSETQKFGHVTFFWNGNRSGKLDETLETYYEVPSDRVPFNQLPKMKAKEIGDAGRDALVSGKYDYVRLNFANGDMVGHTGVFPAVLEACEAVDLGIKVRDTARRLTAWSRMRVFGCDGSLRSSGPGH